jgi:ATP-dependent helicase/nuclease subunit A
MRVTTDADGTEVVTEGVIDAVAHDENGWTVIDWKTDAVEGDDWARRAASYEKQVSAYAEMLAELTGEPASARIERLTDDERR